MYQCINQSINQLQKETTISLLTSYSSYSTLVDQRGLQGWSIIPTLWFLPALNQEHQGHQSRYHGRRLPHVGHGRRVCSGRARTRRRRHTATYKVTVDATIDFDHGARLADFGTTGLVFVAAREKRAVAKVVAITVDADGDIVGVHESGTCRLSVDLGTRLGAGRGGRGHWRGGGRGKARRLSTRSAVGENTVTVIEAGRDAKPDCAKTKIQDVDQRVGCEMCGGRGEKVCVAGNDGVSRQVHVHTVQTDPAS